ncbi:MAG: hypothetical protein Q7S07_02075 [Candidatus Omnitrophota bacterium]|nr:hypothetical protein [Candidatus Omnitrophota bacterium]
MKRIAILVMLFAVMVAGGRPAHSADLSVIIRFDVETDSSSYMQGEPVIVVLVASSPTAMNAHYQNIAAGTAAEKVPEVVLGSPAEPWVDSVKFTVTDNKGESIPVKVSAKGAQADAVTLNGENFAEGTFFVDPMESAKLPSGIYSIRARLKDVESRALILTIVPKEKELTGKESIPQLVKFGRYHLVRGDFQEAKGYAERVLAIDAHSLKGMDMLGDAFTGLGQYREAYATFTKAIDEFFVQNPPSKEPISSCKGPDLFAEKRNKLKKLLK